MKKALLILEDNQIFRGEGFGASGVFSGELIFNTAMTGYVESLTDPSYHNQILLFSYPLIGNYGVSAEWFESKKIYPSAVVVSELCDNPSHSKSDINLNALCKKYHIGGIAGVDTRSLIKFIRNKGTIPAILVVYSEKKQDSIKTVTSQKIKIINTGGRKTIALIDYGVKESIIQNLVQRNLKVIIFPAETDASTIYKYTPDGIVLSNGPGNPKECTYGINTVKQLLNKQIPILGICLGHQLLALASGGNTRKLEFGHHGINLPIMDLVKKHAYITSQNHGYVVEKNSLPKEWKIRFINLNDQTIEGFYHQARPILSCQFHPEANPGPVDMNYIFDEFLDML